MDKMIYANFPVKDLTAATRFYEAIGCRKNEKFSDHQSASMIWSDAINFQLLTRDYFATFTSKQVADAHRSCGVMIAVTCNSREEVDTLVKAAVANGGKTGIREHMELSFMYNRAVEDPDGHVLEFVWLDMNAMPAAASD